jgi:hypothetical protein
VEDGRHDGLGLMGGISPTRAMGVDTLDPAGTMRAARSRDLGFLKAADNLGAEFALEFLTDECRIFARCPERAARFTRGFARFC